MAPASLIEALFTPTMKPALYLLVFALAATACGSTSATPALPTLVSLPTDQSPVPGRSTIAVSPTSTVIPSTGGAGNASAFPDTSAYKWTPVASGLFLPTDIQFPDDGSGRMFVVEQPGRIRIVRNGQMVSPPFLDISDKVGSAGSEQGLLGLAFHPDFAHNPYFYINFTDTNGNTVIARYQARGDQVDLRSEKILMQIDQPFPNHNGGAMLFGPDGDLYIGM